MMKHYLGLPLLLFILLALQPYLGGAQDDPQEFISIDCGLPDNETYSDDITGLRYISDVGFIDSGVNSRVAPAYQTNDLVQQFLNVRYFPVGSRNCYTLRPAQGKRGRYLIRARFMYGNYDGLNQPPKFDLHIGVERWETVQILNAEALQRREIIHTPTSDYINVCLVKTGPGIPFISTLELRPLNDEMYPTKLGSLVYWFRHNVNPAFDPLIRFKDDPYDRIWTNFTLSETRTLTTTSPVDSTRNFFDLPSAVMSSAAEPINPNGNLDFYWDADNSTQKFFLYLHFAELENLPSNESRAFDIFLNGKRWLDEPFIPGYLSAGSAFSDGQGETGNTTYIVEINKTATSTRPPILNAAEVHELLEFSLLETNDEDVGAMLSIKSTYNLTENWQGDPCGPRGFRWIGVNCTNYGDGSDPPRITLLDLSSKKLVGGISTAISDLRELQTLDLSNNNLSGPVPVFLAELPALDVLNLRGNNFTKPFPQALLDKARDRRLAFSYDDEEGQGDQSCQSDSCGKKKKNSVVIPVVASVAAAIFVIFALILAFFIIKRQKRRATLTKVDTEAAAAGLNFGIPEPTTPQYSSLKSNATSDTKFSDNNEYIVATKSRQFTYHEVLQMTNNFQRVIGKGGFGTVYHGYVGDTQVAVKMLSQSSTQGYKEFQAEANLLLTIHHKNLTSLIGYCYEGTNMGIIYEYMSNGNFERHLLGKGQYVLTWEERLRIATDAAQGLEYLHHGCKPPVVHRDVKTTNILLDEKFRAKLADFGLSRAFAVEDGTHAVSTVVAGTPGYLDPEYYSTARLTEKSDVYSFGVVLLEVVSGRPALPRNNGSSHIITWVSSELEKGNLENVVDPRLRGDYAVNSVWKVLEVAMTCVARNSARRPTMNFVVMELKTCLAMETTRNETESKDSIGLISTNMASGFNPQAR